MRGVYRWAGGRTLRHNQIFLPMVSRCARASRVRGAPLKKWSKDTQDKNAIENLGVLTSNATIITFRECI